MSDSEEETQELNHIEFENELEFIAQKVIDFKEKLESAMKSERASDWDELSEIKFSEIEILVGVSEFLIEKSNDYRIGYGENQEMIEQVKAEIPQMI